MVVIVSPENSKKRKKDDVDLKNETTHTSTDVCTQEASPRKNLKFASLPPPIDGDPLSEMSQDSVPDDSQELNDHSLQDPVLGDKDGGNSQKNSLPSSHLPQQQREIDSQTQDQWVLKLDQNYVFIRLLVVFSQEKLPDKITYDGTRYNLTAAYDEFWKTFYKSSYYSKGHEVKIPKVQSVIELELKSMVKILKRGWEDERYWPKELSRPFLEACLFEELNTNSITPETFLNFIEPSEKLLIQNQNTVDENVFHVFQKYCSANIISIGDDIKDSCIKAAHDIMVINMKPVIDIWREELTGLMPMSKFDFLMNPIPTPHLTGIWNDMDGYSAPHELWQTFFLGWPEDKVKYYFHCLANDIYDSNCNLCGESCFNAKHFLCACKPFLETLRLDRHDAVLKMLLEQIDLAIGRKAAYFSKGSDWKVLTSYQNVHYEWPNEMSILKNTNKYPHIIVYSLSEEKALVIEHSISWEHWIKTQKERKKLEYRIIEEQLEKIGFKVEYRVFVLGSRGVLIPDLYDLFDVILGMKHSQISEAHEKISQEILNVPYQSKYYKNLKKIIK